MKKGDGGGPIAPLQPKRPERDPTGKIILQAPGSGPRRLPPGAPTPKALPQSGTGSTSGSNLARRPPSKPPLEEGHISSISVEIDLEDFKEEEKELKGFENLLERLSVILKRLYPSSETQELKATERRLFLDSTEIGTVEKTGSSAKLRIWMHRLGVGVDSLPTSTIFAFFNLSELLFADAASRARYVSILAETTSAGSTIKICFHKEEAPGAFLSAPLRAIKQ